MSKVITDERYLQLREFYRSKGERAVKEDNLNEADYCAGVVRGLDLAFQDGTAKVN